MSTRARGGSERTFEQISHSDTFPLFFPGRTSPSSSSPAYELEPRRAIANPVGTERDSSSPAGLLRADAEELSRRRFGAWAPVRTFEEVPDGPDGEEATGIEERWRVPWSWLMLVCLELPRREMKRSTRANYKKVRRFVLECTWHARSSAAPRGELRSKVVHSLIPLHTGPSDRLRIAYSFLSLAALSAAFLDCTRTAVPKTPATSVKKGT